MYLREQKQSRGRDIYREGSATRDLRSATGRCGRARVLFAVPNTRVPIRNIQRYQIAVYPSGRATTISEREWSDIRGAEGGGLCRVADPSLREDPPLRCDPLRRACRTRELDYPTTRAAGSRSDDNLAPSPPFPPPPSKHDGYPSPHTLLRSTRDEIYETKYKLQVTRWIRVLHPRQGVRRGVRPCRKAVLATPDANFVRGDA